MNKTILSGRLTKDIDLRMTPSGKSVISNTIAVRNDFKNKDGEYDSEFINIQVWNNQAEYLSKYGSKGSKVLVEGRLTNRSYDKQDGTRGYITEVIVSNIELLSTAKGGQNAEKQQVSPVKSGQADPFEEFSEEIEITPDDLPF